jgi:hypothetical protein
LLAGTGHNDPAPEQGPVFEPFETLAIRDNIAKYGNDWRLDIQRNFLNILQLPD